MGEITRAAATPLILVLLCGRAFIAQTRRRQRWQQPRVDTPITHRAKAGTPSMGGALFAPAIVIGALVAAPTPRVVVLCFALLAFALLGLADDLSKALQRPGRGLKARHKLAAQSALALSIGVFLWWTPVRAALPPSAWSWETWGWPFLLWVALVVVACCNAVNITDGLDGLVAGLCFIAFATYGAIAMAQGLGDIAAFHAAVCGGALGFLWFNRHPARVWMGDTGSLALGGALATAALMQGESMLLLLVGIVFAIDAISVIVQVISFQTTGRRVFRKAPLHHGLEEGGWPEPAVVVTAWMVGATGAIAALLLWQLRA